MTGLAADALGLQDRGRVVPGAVADLVLFDASRVADRATYERPAQAAVGVEMVLLGGRVVLDHGVVVDPGAGKVLRRRRGRAAPHPGRAAG